MRRFISLFLMFVVLIAALPLSGVQAQNPSPWDSVFDEDGDLRSDVVDLGVTTDTPDWMCLDLPFGQSLQLDANYHRFQTADGNLVVLPSATTLFFMAMNPQESGLAGSAGMLSSGMGGLISFLGAVAGDSLDWNRLQQEHPEYMDPSQFWNAVLSGQENAWTWFSGWNFITNLISLSWDDAALRTAYLLYLNGARNCAQVPGGCAGIVLPEPPPPLCPGPQVTIQQPTLSIRKLAPTNPLVVGQDTERKRGADVQALVTIPPVIFVWHEAIYEEKDVCRPAAAWETPNCAAGSASPSYDGVQDTELVFKECRRHVERLPDAVVNLQATAALDGASQGWITDQLGQTHYGAYVHQPSFALVPGLTSWSGGCAGDGTCSATATALQVPFADPGKFNLKLRVTTSGTRFHGTVITRPRSLSADGELQVYVTLPALVP